jgi:aspartyl-tRNA(Asn)/glutamyl-tRNA(Gln) amidotransferase subunit C
MQLNTEIIDKLAALSRLSFDEEEKAQLLQDLNNMLGFVDKLNETDTTGVEPLLHITSSENVFRDDEVKTEVTKAEVLSNTGLKNADFFMVPKVINK